MKNLLTIIFTMLILVMGFDGGTFSYSAEVGCSPVVVAVMIDKTASATWTRTPLPATGDFDDVYQALKNCGIELGVGLVTDRSNKALLRVRIDRPPLKPVAPNSAGNPFTVAKQLGEYQNVIKEYEEKTATWNKAVEKKWSLFITQLEFLLSEPPAAPMTDVWGAVARAELFLSEDDKSWQSKPIKYGIIVSDCQDNKHNPVVIPQSGATWLVVNGTPADLNILSPLHFEAVQAAFRHITTKTRGG